MLIKVNNDSLLLEEMIRNKCGKKNTFIDRFLYRNFGTSRYRLINILPEHKEIDLSNYNDSIFLNFDLRKKGIVFYFRYKNTEYVEACPFYSLTFQSNDKSLVMQSDKYTYSFEILNEKNHKKFILKIYDFKSKLDR